MRPGRFRFRCWGGMLLNVNDMKHEMMSTLARSSSSTTTQGAAEMVWIIRCVLLNPK